MNNSLKNKNLFRDGLTKKVSDKILIGGADLTDIPSKENLIDQKIEIAKERVEKEAKAIIEAAEERANEIIRSAEANRDSVLEQAQQEGFNTGYQEGLAQAKNEVAEMLNSSQQILEAVEKERQECIADETLRIYKVICLIAKKLIKHDLQTSEQVSIEFINQALKKLEYKSEVNILINPQLAKQINHLKAEIIDSCPGLERITISASESLEPGDLILESNKERLDLRFDSQLEELIKEISK